MSCSKCKEFGWREDLPVVYKNDEGEEYCVFHAPQGKKGIPVKKFNELIFERINKAKKSNTECILEGTVFEGDIVFSQFGKDNPLPAIGFAKATFSKKADFWKVTFSKKTNFWQATFSKDANFGETTFNKEANFTKATFNKKVDFGEAIFNEDVYFTITTFSKRVDFVKTTFNENAHFLLAKFNGEAHFFITTFSKGASFGEATFSEDAYFMVARFNGGVGFAQATFSKKACFKGATFNKKAYFGKATFSEKTEFTGLTIAEKIRFEGVNLSALTFIDTDLTKIDFINCKWSKGHGRNLLYDEICLFRNNEENAQEDKKTEGILPRLKQSLKQQWAGFLKDISCDKEEIKKVEILYRQLKRKCKEEHNEIDISDWHYGEKEMFRKGSRFRRFFPLSLAHLYWLSSGYGERPRRAGIVLICLMLLISVLFGFAGLIPDLELKQKLTLEPINGIKDFVKNPFEVLVNTLQYATFEKDTYFMPQNIWGTFLKILAKLFIPLQAALFAFSVRNRFRR